MKKFSLISNQEIRKHLANTSPAKITHSFSKSRRFLNPNPQCKEAFYGSSSSLSKRQTAIGYGSKLDFTKNTIVSPGSPTYKQRSQFQRMGRTHAFGIGRQKSPERNYIYHFQKARVPGPGTYQNQVKTKMNVSYSHRARTIDLDKKKLSFLQNPGPGRYESVDLNPIEGRFRLSKYNDSKLSIISKDSRFKQLKHRSPGPVVYTNIDPLNEKSKYILSNRRGHGTRPFDRQKKFRIDYWKYDKNPAPGTYQKPSDFGVYGDLNYYKTLSTKM